MEFPWYILIFTTVGFLTSGYEIEKGPSDLILNFTRENDDMYTVLLKENNHIEGSDNLLLFTLKEVSSSALNWQYGQPMFTNKVQPKEDSTTDYEFYITQYIDYETEVSHFYLITIIAGTDVIVINVNIFNYDDESPTLTAPMCSMKENTDYDESNTTCTSVLSDPDGWLSQTTFTIINSNSNTDDQEDKLFQFSFDRTISDIEYNTTVYLTTLQQLDYERKIFYSFVVQAKDGANHSTIPNKDVTCIIDVIDQNDMPPEWTDYFTTTQIKEKAPYTFSVTAVDGNRGINAPIEYFLVSYDEDVCTGSCVAITTENGKGIITVDPIDRDARDLTTYKFQIKAVEKADPPYFVTLDITFFIEDIDDNNPLFMNVTRNNDTNFDFTVEEKIANFSFYENFAGTINGQIFIQDIDTGENAQFTVKLNEDDLREHDDVEYTDAFLITPTAGYRSGMFEINVKNSKYLDFENETWQNISFYVHSEGKNESREDNLLINIHLLDYNDELPIFEKASYSIAVNETIKLGQEVITVKATDRDAEDAILRHELVGADVIISLITIDPEEGVITVAQNNAFDYDRINPIIFQVQAIDKVNHITTVSVVVNLLDINNKAPTYKVEDVIRVDENQVIGIKLNATITASDVDTTRNLTAEIDWEESYAMKNSQKLNTSDPTMLKAMQFLYLTYNKTHDDTISIDLFVNDNNTNETAPDYETFDTLYLKVIITDLNTELPEFQHEMSIEALIVININDINDNPPIFTDETLQKNRTIYELSPKGTIVGTIVAIDADVGDVVTYSCTYVDENLDWFSCDTSGQLTANTGQVDADTNRTFNVSINCDATDGFFHTHQIFDIYILDKNNKEPFIEVNGSLDTKVVEILEKSPANTPVVEFGWQDADRDVPFHTVKCILNLTEECSESFKIEDNVLKVLTGESDIDRDEGKPDYSCTPTCYDNPNLEQNEGQNYNTSTTFTIKLIDINDHCPEVQLPSDLEKKENVLEGESLGTVIAKDIDEGDNAEIEMSILTVTKLELNEDYTDQGLFRIEKKDDYNINLTMKQWHLVANKDLRNYYGEYAIQLNVSDLGTPQQSTEQQENIEKGLKEKALILVSILKYNYYEPVFTFPNASKLSFSLNPDQEPGKPLVMYYNNDTFLDVRIIDGEDDSCSAKWEPTYDAELIGKSFSVRNFFIIKNLTSCTAQLQVDDSYDRSEALNIVSYQLQLTATLDNTTVIDGEPSHSVLIDILLNFVDLTDDPVFNVSMGPWDIQLQEDNDTESAELPKDRWAVYANREDSDDIRKYYSLKSEDQDIKDTFEIEEDTGNVKLKRKLDYLEEQSYDFQMLASRSQSGIPTKSASTMDVTVKVIDINNHVPEWTQDSFFGALLKSTPKGATIVTLNATDLDEIDKDLLTYYINSTIEATGSDSIQSIEQPFLLNTITGQITLNFSVDYNMNGYFRFSVKVQDVQDEYGHGPFDNITTVTIHIVTDDNIVVFKFENTLDWVVAKKSEILDAVSTCLGWDCHDQSIDHDSQDGVTLNNVTAASIYCVENNMLLSNTDMKSKLNNINTFQQLKQSLLENGVLLQTFNSDSNPIVNLENTLKMALIGVSVVLGALCLILGITFFLKARELSRRLKKLTQPKFGSDESNLNRQGMHFPTTNIFAVEGSNPVFNTEMTKKDLSRDDITSIHSTNSDLIGVEDSPEFDDMFGERRD